MKETDVLEILDYCFKNLEVTYNTDSYLSFNRFPNSKLPHFELIQIIKESEDFFFFETPFYRIYIMYRAENKDILKHEFTLKNSKQLKSLFNNGLLYAKAHKELKRRESERQKLSVIKKAFDNLKEENNAK
jgi:hypothetical protein